MEMKAGWVLSRVPGFNEGQANWLLLHRLDDEPVDQFVEGHFVLVEVKRRVDEICRNDAKRLSRLEDVDRAPIPLDVDGTGLDDRVVGAAKAEQRRSDEKYKGRVTKHEDLQVRLK